MSKDSINMQALAQESSFIALFSEIPNRLSTIVCIGVCPEGGVLVGRLLGNKGRPSYLELRSQRLGNGP